MVSGVVSVCVRTAKLSRAKLNKLRTAATAEYYFTRPNAASRRHNIPILEKQLETPEPDGWLD